MTVALWTHWIAPGMALWEHQHVCISVARQTPNGSGRRCPLPSLPATTWASQLSTPSASPSYPLSHFLCTCLWMLAYNVDCLPCFPIYSTLSQLSPVHLLRASLPPFIQVFLISAFSSCSPTWAGHVLSEPCCLCVHSSLFFYYPGILLP